MSDRTLKVTSPHQTGSDVTAWQRAINNQLNRWHADDLLKVDGDYGITSRSFTSRVLYGLGIPQSAMADGVTPELRIKVREQNLSPADRVRYVARAAWRKNLSAPKVASPLHKVLADSWGYHPGVHDGMDLICDPEAPIYAMTAGTIVRADPSGWWGLGAPSDQALKAKGDGIIILRCGEDVGPFRKGMNLCYGHAEGAVVNAGEKVKAGQHLGHAGLANAWHVHFMVNDNPDTRGVGDRDPRPFYDYAKKNG